VRVCFVTQTFPDWAGSPRGVFIKRLADLLQARGVAVAVVAPRMLRGSPEREVIEGIPVYRFPFFSDGSLLFEAKRVPARMVAYMMNGLLYTVAATLYHRCDLIHAHWVVPTGLLGLLAGRLTGRPVVASAHGTDLLVWGRKRGPVGRLASATLRGVARCTVNSPAIAEVAIQCGLQRERLVEVKETGVDLARFASSVEGEAIRRRYYIPEHAVVVLFAAHLTSVKRPDWMLRAFAGLRHVTPCAHLLMVGDGPAMPDVRRLAHSLGLGDSVTLAGSARHESMPAYFAAADAFVLPSEREGLGIVLMEAMASGKPVVAARVGGIPSVVGEGTTGLLFGRDDFAGFARALTELCTDAPLRRAMGEAGRRRAEAEFGETQQVDAVLRMYREVLGVREPTGAHSPQPASGATTET